MPTLPYPRTGGNEAHTKTFFATLFPYSASGVYNLLKKESKSVVLSYAEYVKRSFAKGTAFETKNGMSYLKCADICIFDNKCLALFGNGPGNIFELTESGIGSALYTVTELTNDQLLELIGDDSVVIDTTNVHTRAAKIDSIGNELYLVINYDIPYTSADVTYYGKGYAVYHYDTNSNTLSLLYKNHTNDTTDDNANYVYAFSVIGNDKLFIATSLTTTDEGGVATKLPKYVVIDTVSKSTTSLDLYTATDGTMAELRVSAYTIDGEWYINIRSDSNMVYKLTFNEDDTVSVSNAELAESDMVEVLNVGDDMVPVSFDTNYSLQILSDYKTFDKESEATKTEMGFSSNIQTIYPYIGNSFLVYPPNSTRLIIVNIVTE